MAVNQWSSKGFGDCAELVRDTVHPAEAKSMPYIGLEHIAENKLAIIGHGTSDDVTSMKSRFKKGDILFGKLRPYFRKVVIAPFEGVCSTDIWVVRPKANIDRRYLFYWMASQEFVDESMRGSGGTKMPRAQWEFVSRINRNIPSLSEQEAIGLILGTLDDKIELNRKMNENLEAMARALFKSWFVDFDPVRAKVAGRDTGLPKHIADLFPDSFEDSELGEIPKGWEVKPFADSVEIIGGGTPKTTVAEYWDGDIPWFSIVDAPGGSDVWVVDTGKKISQKGIEYSSTQILPVGTIIISARGTVGRIALVGVPMAMNQSCYGLRGKVESSRMFTYFSTKELVGSLQQHAHGSVFDTITRETLAGVSIFMPSEKLIDAYECRVGPLLNRIRTSLFCSRTLAALRDTLLPKLISGELSVRDAERVIGESV